MYFAWFLSRSVRAAVKAYKQEATRVRDSESGPFSAATGLMALDRELRKAIYTSRATLDRMLSVEQTRARTAVLLLISNLSRQQLASGRHHVYRGKLSMGGLGIEALWRYATAALVDLGEITLEQADAARARLRGEIESAG